MCVVSLSDRTNQSMQRPACRSGSVWFLAFGFWLGIFFFGFQIPTGFSQDDAICFSCVRGAGCGTTWNIERRTNQCVHV